MGSRLEKLYIKIKNELIDSKEVKFYEDLGIETITFITKEKCLGCFEIVGGVPNLIVAIGGEKETAYGTFLHEYFHFMQWKEGVEVYKNEYLTTKEAKRFRRFFNKKVKNIECGMILDYWKTGQYELNDSDLSSFTKRTILVERDCEERVIALLKEHKVSKKYINDYTQSANMYLIKYLYQKKHRMWKDTEKAYKKMPKVLLKLEELESLSEEYENLILKHIKKEEG